MPRLRTKVSPPVADESKQRRRCAIEIGWPLPDLHEMLDAASENPVKADTSAGPATDDLLSQMAGKEIDRLLADAGLEPPAEVSAAQAAAAAPTAVQATDAAPSSPAKATSVQAAIADPASSSNPNAAIVEKELDQIVERQLDQAITTPAEAENASAAAAVATGTVAPPALDTADAAAKSEVSALLDRLEAGEREVSASPTADAESKPAASAAAVPEASDAAPDVSGADDPDEIVLPQSSAADLTLTGRVLDWVTLPLDPFPAPLRDVIGKIAIITTINAAAILAYITFFRK
jgi:hypothetical protein